MSGRSNLHPAVAGAIPQTSNLFGGPLSTDQSPLATKNLFGSFTGPNPLSPTYDQQLSMNEGLARTRARELMQSYARDKQRANDLEQQVSRMGADNDELALVATQLQRQVRELKDHNAVLEDSHATERDDMEATVAHLKSEIERVSALSAHQVGDLMAQLRLREEETIHLQSELVRCGEENSHLQRELSSGAGKEGSSMAVDLQKAQTRSVELARRLLDSERAKRSAEEALMEDRRHHHLALNTIEQLRQQLATSEGRVDTERRKREDEVLHLRRQLDQVREECAQREGAYNRVLKGVGAAPDETKGNTADDDSVSPVRRVDAEAAPSNSLATLCSTLEARTQSQQEHIDFLTSQNEKLNKQLQVVLKDLQSEKTRRVDDTAKSQELIRELKDDGTRRELLVARKDKDRVVTALTELKTLYEDSISHLASWASPTKASSMSRSTSTVDTISRRLDDIYSSLRELIATAQAPVRVEEVVINATQNVTGPDSQTQRLIEVLTQQLMTRQASRTPNASKTPGSAEVSLAGTGEADEFVSDREGSSHRTGSLIPHGVTHNAIVAYEFQRQNEMLRKQLDEEERERHRLINERDEREANLEKELRSQLETLVAHTQKLQRQATADADELDNVRYQLQTVESTAAVKLARTRRDCARSIEGLHSILKQIEAEHQEMLTRRYASPSKVVVGGDATEKRLWDRSSHAYYYGADEQSPSATGAETRLGEKIHDALQQQEALLREWVGDETHFATDSRVGLQHSAQPAFTSDRHLHMSEGY